MSFAGEGGMIFVSSLRVHVQIPIFIFDRALAPKPAPFLQIAVDRPNSIPAIATGLAVIWQFAPPDRSLGTQGPEVVENNIWPELRAQ